MNYSLAVITANLVSLCSVSLAGFLAYHDKDGWGYFLFVAVLCAASVSYDKKKAKEDSEE